MAVFKIAYSNEIYRYLFNKYTTDIIWWSDGCIEVKLKCNKLNNYCSSSYAIKVMLEDLQAKKNLETTIYDYLPEKGILYEFIVKKIADFKVSKQYINIRFKFKSISSFYNEEAENRFDLVK